MNPQLVAIQPHVSANGTLISTRVAATPHLAINATTCTGMNPRGRYRLGVKGVWRKGGVTQEIEK